MAEIEVKLKASFDKTQASQAARDMASTVQSAAGGGGGKAGGVQDWVARQRANTAAGGVFNSTSGFSAPAGGGGGGGAMTAAGAAATGGAAGGIASLIVQAVIKAIQMMVQAINSAIRALVNALNSAASFYAKQLQSGGISGGLMAQRGGLASVIGVGEHEVWQYGKAVQHLNYRLQFSSQINASVNRSVTGAAWSMRILGEDFKALAQVAANSLAPAIRQLATLFHALTAGLGPMFVKFFVQLFKSTLEVALRQVFGAAAMNFVKGLLAKIDPGAAPGASASAHRIQSSAWERMGLVIGQGVNSNPLKATERNTRRAAETLKKIEGFLAPRSSANGPQMKTIPNGV